MQILIRFSCSVGAKILNSAPPMLKRNGKVWKQLSRACGIMALAMSIITGSGIGLAWEWWTIFKAMIQRVTNLVVHILSGMSLSTGTYSYLRVTLRLPPQRPLFALHMGLTCGGQIDNRTKDKDLISTQLHTIGGDLAEFSQCGCNYTIFTYPFHDNAR